MRPYKDGERTFIDVQQIIPLPEAHDYQVQLREKGTESRKQRADHHDLRKKYWEGVVAIAKETAGRHANIKPGSYQWIGSGSGNSWIRLESLSLSTLRMPNSTLIEATTIRTNLSLINCMPAVRKLREQSRFPWNGSGSIIGVPAG
jgi:hypothetical protein